MDSLDKDRGAFVETRSDTSNYELERSLPRGKNIKAIGLMEDELGGQIMTEIAALTPKHRAI